MKLDDNTAKSIACLIPFLVDVVEVELKNNSITDNIAGAIAIACFANPKIDRITIAYNYLRGGFTKTFQALTREAPLKIQYINLMGSINDPQHVRPIAKGFDSMECLKSLDLSGCALD